MWEGCQEETSPLPLKLHHKIAACITCGGAGNISQRQIVQVGKITFPTVRRRDKLLNLVCSEHIVLDGDRRLLLQGL